MLLLKVETCTSCCVSVVYLLWQAENMLAELEAEMDRAVEAVAPPADPLQEGENSAAEPAGPTEPEVPAAEPEVAAAEPEVLPEPEVSAVPAGEDGDTTTCAICQQLLRPAEGHRETLEATQCGHVHHKVCLERWWSFGHRRGACPYKCHWSVPLGSHLSLQDSAQPQQERTDDDERLEQELGEEAAAPQPIML